MSAAVLEASGLRRRFGGLVALDGVDVRVDAAQVVAIVGPNGSGKTTLLNAVTGAERLDAGSVRLEGREVRGWGAARLARHGVARTFQDGRLLEGVSALENVLLGLHASAGGVGAVRGSLPGGARRRRERGMEALAAVGLADLWERRAAVLSHGQRRRLEIARVLAARPHLMVLDEPTGGLTPDDTEAVAGLVAAAATAGAAVLLVEHDLDVVGALAATVLVLDAGRTVASGPPVAVLRAPEVARLLGDADDAAARLATA